MNSQKMLPTGVTVFEPAALSGGGIWKKNYFNKIFYDLKKRTITTLQLGNGVTYSYVSVNYEFFSAEVAFSV